MTNTRMHEHDWLAERFEADRSRLRAMAYRMLGSLSEADDAVQEAWLHVSRSGADGVQNLGGWLSTVVARVCFDMLRSRTSRREEPLEVMGEHVPEVAASHEAGIDPEHEAIMADSVGLALLVVLETLTPAERLAFVLHDMFGVPFEEIAPIVGRTPTATRKLASRARHRVQGKGVVEERGADFGRRREIVEAFLAASRGGDFEALVALLAPNVLLRADRAAVAAGATAEVRGAEAVAGAFSGRARGAQPAMVEGAIGAVWAPGGQPRFAFAFTIKHGKIAKINILADPDPLRQVTLL